MKQLSRRTQQGIERAYNSTLDGRCDVFNVVDTETESGNSEGYTGGPDPTGTFVKCRVDPVSADERLEGVERVNRRVIRISLSHTVVVNQSAKIRVYLFDDRGQPRIIPDTDPPQQMFEDYMVEQGQEDRTAQSFDKKVIASRSNQA
jgi:hypothetical protein